MKSYIVVVLVSCWCFVGFSQKEQQIKLKNNAEKDFLDFEEDLKKRIITPSYRIEVESDTIRFEDCLITVSKNGEPLEIRINNDTIFVNDMFTQNIVWGYKNQLDYSNAVSLIHYYSYYNILMFQTHFYPCSGLGCGVNFQILYHTKTKKSFAFGRFRTGFDMELYNYNDDKVYYLSKSFNGRNIQGIDTVKYELFPIDFLQEELKPLDNIFAEEVYDNNEEKIISFKKQWINNE